MNGRAADTRPPTSNGLPKAWFSRYRHEHRARVAPSPRYRRALDHPGLRRGVRRVPRVARLREGHAAKEEGDVRANGDGAPPGRAEDHDAASSCDDALAARDGGRGEQEARTRSRACDRDRDGVDAGVARGGLCGARALDRRRRAPARRRRLGVPRRHGHRRLALLHRPLRGLARASLGRPRAPVVSVRDARRRERSRGERGGRVSAGVHQRRARAGGVRGVGQAIVQANRVANGVHGAEEAALPVRQRAPRQRLQRPRPRADGPLLSAGGDELELGRDDGDERPPSQSVGRHPDEDGVERRLHERVRRLRHGRQPPRVDQRSERDVPGRLLPRHAHQRRWLRVPNDRPRVHLSRLLDRLPLLRRRDHRQRELGVEHAGHADLDFAARRACSVAHVCSNDRRASSHSHDGAERHGLAARASSVPDPYESTVPQQ